MIATLILWVVGFVIIGFLLSTLWNYLPKDIKNFIKKQIKKIGGKKENGK